MAKTSSIEKNNRRRKMAAQSAAKRKRLKEIANDLKRQAEERFAARLKLAEMPRIFSNAHPQPLRAHRPRAGHLSQVQAVPQPASRTRQPGSYSRHREVELVRERRRWQ